MKLKLSNLMSVLGDRSASQQQVSATVLFADICGSTRLFEKFGDLDARRIETRVLELLTAKTEANGGTVIKTIGDEIMSRFPDAQQAVRAACEMHQALRDDPDLDELNIAIKVGLHHGPVLVEKNDVFGDAFAGLPRERVVLSPVRTELPDTIALADWHLEGKNAEDRIESLVSGVIRLHRD